MESIKKKKGKRRLIIFFSVCIILLLSVRIQSWYVRKEFENIGDIAYLLDTDFEWKENNYYIINCFGSESNMWGYNYVVTPFGRFFARWIYSPNMGYLQNKFELGFPRRVWYHMGDSGIFIHPQKKIKENEIELYYSSQMQIKHFNRGCSLSEVENEFDFNTIEWLWVDTYEEMDTSKFEYFERNADLENCAYGISCSGYNNLESAAEHFIDLLNKYNDEQYLKTGKYLNKVKTGIKKEGEITLDDLVVIGVEFKHGFNFNRKSSIIRDVKEELKGK